jgi:hypothetical protein
LLFNAIQAIAGSAPTATNPDAAIDQASRPPFADFELGRPTRG